MKKFIKKLHQDERGDAIQTILIVAAIAVPLLVALIAFGTDIVSNMSTETQEVAKDKTQPIKEGYKKPLTGG